MADVSGVSTAPATDFNAAALTDKITQSAQDNALMIAATAKASGITTEAQVNATQELNKNRVLGDTIGAAATAASRQSGALSNIA